MMTEKQFENLREHLDLVLPIVNKFCSLNGYQHVDPRSIGRYPRIRIEKKGEVTRWLDLWMGCDDEGNRYESFFDFIPYDLSAGANYDVSDGTLYGHRFQKSFLVFSRKPFKIVHETLLQDLWNGAAEIEQWSTEMLKSQGKRVDLGKK